MFLMYVIDVFEIDVFDNCFVFMNLFGALQQIKVVNKDFVESVKRNGNKGLHETKWETVLRLKMLCFQCLYNIVTSSHHEHIYSNKATF